MITRNELTAVGKVIKTHGTAGMLNLDLYDPDVFDPQVGDCIVLNVDGIFVPFFIDESRTRGGHGAIIKLNDIDSDAEASFLTGKEAFAVTKRMKLVDIDDEDDDSLTIDDLVGYTIHDVDGTVVGRIVDINDDTDNVLFAVERPDGTDIFVPAASELVTDVDTDTKILIMNLPTGLY